MVNVERSGDQGDSTYDHNEVSNSMSGKFYGRACNIFSCGQIGNEGNLPVDMSCFCAQAMMEWT